MRHEKSRHKRKYSPRNIDYKESPGGNARHIPVGTKISILLGGVIQFIGIVFTITGLGFLLPFMMTDAPTELIWLPAIFPTVGILMLYFSVRKRAKYLQIIKTGKFTYGKFKNSEATNVTINNSRVYRYYFDFKDETGNVFTAKGETHTGRLSDEDQELLVYNPNSPDQSVMIDALPHSAKNYILKIMEEESGEDVISDYLII